MKHFEKERKGYYRYYWKNWKNWLLSLSLSVKNGLSVIPAPPLLAFFVLWSNKLSYSVKLCMWPYVTNIIAHPKKFHATLLPKVSGNPPSECFCDFWLDLGRYLKKSSYLKIRFISILPISWFFNKITNISQLSEFKILSITY